MLLLISESLKQEGIFPASTYLQPEDVIRVLKQFEDPRYKGVILPLCASLAPQTLSDPSLTNIMQQAKDILQEKPNEHVLFLVGYSEHWYLGEALCDQDNNSIRFTLHDVRPHAPENLNQQHVVQTFAVTAAALKIETTAPQFAYPDDVEWKHGNCGDLVITRGLKLMGFTPDLDLLKSRTPDELRKAVIEAATFKSDITDANIEFVHTLHGVAALNTKHQNYAQLAAPAPAPQQQSARKQTSSSCTYAALQQIPRFCAGEIAKAIGNDANKQKAFVAANKAMNEFLDSSNTDKTTFEATFDAMSRAVKNGDESKIESIKDRFTRPTT